MLNNILPIIGGGLVILWGIAHLIPTKSVIKGFWGISEDNKNILLMEWIIEGLALMFIGIISIITIIFSDMENSLRNPILIACSVMLFVLAIESLFTGFKVKMIPFKMCPFIFSISAILILSGIYII